MGSLVETSAPLRETSMVSANSIFLAEGVVPAQAYRKAQA